MWYYNYKEEFKVIKKYIKKCEMYSMIISILMIVLSLFLIFKPVKSIETFVLLFSIIMLVNGVIGVITYFTIESDERLFSFDLLSGITNIIAGVLVFIYRSSLVEVFPIMLGIYVIVSSMLKMQISINLSTVPESNWVLLVIMSILNMIIGILLITNPFESIITITTLCGIFLLASEVISLIEEIYVLIKIKKFEKTIGI